MEEYRLVKTFDKPTEASDKVYSVLRMFGLCAEGLFLKTKTHRCKLLTEAGDIVFFTGPSGSGKSVLLRELRGKIPASKRIDLEEIDLEKDKALVDCIEGDFVTSLRTLNSAGLNDVVCILNKPVNLSEGQKYRYRLAKALASGKQFIFADEFCSALDRITASVIAWNIRRFADKNKVTFILASSHDDILIDLEPDILIKKDFSDDAEVVYRDCRRQKGV